MYLPKDYLSTLHPLHTSSGKGCFFKYQFAHYFETIFDMNLSVLSLPSTKQHSLNSLNLTHSDNQTVFNKCWQTTWAVFTSSILIFFYPAAHYAVFVVIMQYSLSSLPCRLRCFSTQLMKVTVTACPSTLSRYSKLVQLNLATGQV